MSFRTMTSSNPSQAGENLSSFGSQQSRYGHTGSSSPQEYPLGAGGSMEPRSRRALGGSARTGRVEQGAHARYQEQNSQALGEGNSSSLEETDQKRTLKTKLHRAWMRLNDPDVDPDFSQLPRGLSNRVHPKDPFRDKLRRLRRLKLKFPRQKPKKRPQQQCPSPIYWPAPVTRRASPRRAPAVESHEAMVSLRPDNNSNRNPYEGGDYFVHYESKESREGRNQATQRGLKERTASDRLLARRGQQHLRNWRIGRAPPLRKRYINEEVDRLAWNPTDTPRVVTDPKDLGLPADGARNVEGDRAILPSKSVPDFQKQKEGEEAHQPKKDDSRGNAQLENDDAATVLIVEWLAGIGTTDEQTNPDTLSRQSGLPLTYEESGARLDSQSIDGSSNYSDRPDTDSDVDYPIHNDNTVPYDSEYHAEIYRQEIENLRLSEPDDSLSETSTPVVPSQPLEQYHSTQIPAVAANTSVEHRETESGYGLGLTANGLALQLKIPNLESGKGGASNSIPSGSNSLNSEHKGQKPCNISPPVFNPSLEHTIHETSNLAAQGNYSQTPPVTFGSTKAPSYFQHQKYQREEQHVQRQNIVQSPAALGGPYHQLSDRTPWMTSQNRRPPNPPDRSQGSHIPRGKQFTHPLPQRPTWGDEYSLARPSQISLHDQYSSREPTRPLPQRPTLGDEYSLARPSQRSLHGQYSSREPTRPLPQRPTLGDEYSLARPSQRSLHGQYSSRETTRPLPQRPTWGGEQGEHSLARPSQRSLHDQYSSRERITYSIHDDSEDDIPLAQEGPYPKISGRNMPDVEELARPSRRRATTNRSRSSQETDRGIHSTKTNNTPPSLKGRQLRLEDRPQRVDSRGFQTSSSSRPVITGNRGFQSNQIARRDGQQQGGEHGLSGTSKQFNSLHRAQ